MALNAISFLVKVDEGREDPNTTIIMWLFLAADAMRLSAVCDCGISCSCSLFFRGSGPVLLRNPMALRFSGVCVWTPCPPLDPCMKSTDYTDRLYIVTVVKGNNYICL